MIALTLALSVFLAADARVDAGIAAFNEANFAKSRDALAVLVDEPSLAPADRATARIYLAASYHALGDVASARAQLILLARQHPDARLDPVVFLPELVALADEARAQVERERAASPPKLVPRTEPPPAVSTTREQPAFALALVPFGVGQFANGQTGKGAAFLGAELVLAAACVVSSAMLGSLSLGGRDGIIWVPDGQQAQAGALQTTRVASFWGTIAVAAIGIGDAIYVRSSAP